MTAKLTKEIENSELLVTQKHILKVGNIAFMLWKILVKIIASDLDLMDLYVENVPVMQLFTSSSCSSYEMSKEKRVGSCRIYKHDPTLFSWRLGWVARSKTLRTDVWMPYETLCVLTIIICYILHVMKVANLCQIQITLWWQKNGQPVAMMVQFQEAPDATGALFHHISREAFGIATHAAIGALFEEMLLWVVPESLDKRPLWVFRLKNLNSYS